MVAVSAAVLALLFGSVIGMLSGYFRAFDMALMRIMDGLMAIPAILLAIALVAALGANAWPRWWWPSPCPKFHAFRAWCARWC